MKPEAFQELKPRSQVAPAIANRSVSRQSPMRSRPTTTQVSAPKPAAPPISMHSFKPVQHAANTHSISVDSKMQRMKPAMPHVSASMHPKSKIPITKVKIAPAQDINMPRRAMPIRSKQLVSDFKPVKSLNVPKPQLPQSQRSIHKPVAAPVSAPAPLFETVIERERSKGHINKKARRIQLAFMSAGVLIFIIGLTVSIMGLRANQEVVAQAKNMSAQQSGDNQSGSGDDPVPAENPIGRNMIAAHKVAPDEPRKLIIPKIGVDTRVLNMGLKDNGQLKTPNNIFDSGWYSGSAKPGQSGATLIDGHVHGSTVPGVFYNLKRLVKDDTILVEKGDGKQIKYKVVKTQVYDAENTDMQAAMKPIEDNKSGLNLITCTGKINKKNNTYNERLIVFATTIE